jgi:dTDP-4-dehydrorhamnose 3,5-epimerase
VTFTELPLDGAFVLDLEPFADERGFFARTFDREAFAARGLATHLEQASVSFNHRRGTLRGLHFQLEPWAEAKLVRCTAGAIFDVVVDLRPGSPTLGRHATVLLEATTRRQVYIPPGFAHGFQTLADDTEVSYLISAPFRPEAARGYRFDDPTFDILWPEPIRVISERDRALPFFTPEAGR